MKLLIVDDHPVLREGLAALLKQISPDTEVLVAADSQEGLRTVETHTDIDLALLDLMMPGMGGLQAIREFGRRRPELPVVVLSSSEDPEDVRRAIASGALGFVPKSASPRTLLSAVRLVLSGEVYIPQFMAQEASRSTAYARSDPGPAAVTRLTDRQIEVLKLLAKGFANKQIGEGLGLADQTVKAHITAIFKVLGVVNRTQAANIAHESGLV
jgi:two-component system nitrate/nitrite response regulator NarL